MKLPFEYAVLGALMKRPMHGYDLHKFLSYGLGMVWHVGISNIYAILKKLEVDGHIRSTVETQGNRPAKRVFAVTQKGEAVFKEWISRPVHSIRDMRVEFIAKLYFLRELGLKEGEALVEAQRAVCRRILESVDASVTTKSDLARLLFEFRTVQIRSILCWLEACESFLKRPTENR